MSGKGTSIVISATALVPAIAMLRVQATVRDNKLATIRSLVKEGLESEGILSGERAKGQLECANAVADAAAQLVGVFSELTEATSKVYDTYIDAETAKSIDKAVADATAKTTGKAQASALKGK